MQSVSAQLVGCERKSAKWRTISELKRKKGNEMSDSSKMMPGDYATWIVRTSHLQGTYEVTSDKEATDVKYVLCICWFYQNLSLSLN